MLWIRFDKADKKAHPCGTEIGRENIVRTSRVAVRDHHHGARTLPRGQVQNVPQHAVNIGSACRDELPGGKVAGGRGMHDG